MAKKLDKEYRKAVSRSGYLFEQRLAAFLKNEGYYVVPNYSFKDPETGEHREVDVWAYGATAISRGNREFIFPMLLIEAKNIASPLVFFTQTEIPISELMGEVHLSGLPTEVVQSRKTQELGKYLDFEKFHHYYRKDRLASQFCVVYRKNKECIADHKFPNGINIYHEAILPLAKAVHFEKQDHEENWRYVPGAEVINLNFYYPILVTRGEIYECYLGGVRPRYRRVHRIGFIRRYHSEKMKGEYRIDVVSETGFHALVRLIDGEMKEMAKRIRRKQKILRNNANRIAKEKLRRKGRKGRKIMMPGAPQEQQSGASESGSEGQVSAPAVPGVALPSESS